MARKVKKKPAKPARPSPFEELCAGEPLARNEGRVILVILLVAAALRIAYFILNTTGNPLLHHPSLDARYHNDWALEIIGGNFWGDEVFFRAPLYPYFVALLYKVSGSSIVFVVLVQHLLGITNVLLVYVLARRYFAVAVSATAGVLAALYWPFVFFEGELLIVTLFITLTLLSLLLLESAVRTGRLLHVITAGAAIGLAATARPTILVLLPLVPVVFALGNDRARAAGGARGTETTEAPQRRQWWKDTLLLFVGVAIVIAPVMVRNYVVGRDIVPIASQGGVNFYIGNNPQSNGTQAIVPNAPGGLYGTIHGAIELAQRDVGRPMKPSEVSNYYLSKGLGFIRDDPAAAASLTGRKFYFLISGTERSNSKYLQFFWRRFGLGRFPLPAFWFIAPFAVMGGVLLWKRRRTLSLLYLLTAAYGLSIALFFVNTRFRLPVVPVLCIFAGYALCYLWYAFRNDRSRLWKAIVLLVICTAVVDWEFVSARGVRAFDEAVSYYSLGKAYAEDGVNDKALAAFENARATQERYPTRGYQQISDFVDYRLGTLYKDKRSYSQAITALARIQSNPAIVPRARGMLGDCLVEMGRFEDAEALHTGTLARTPDEPWALVGLGRVYLATGRSSEAKRIAGQLRGMALDDDDLVRAVAQLLRATEN